MFKAFRQFLIAIGIANCVALPALSNPTGGEVVNGSAIISSPSAGVLEVINSPGAIINWQDFSIDVNEVTRFIQQNMGSSVLNRVVGGDPSEILGQLSSNGQVWLINPNGIAFGNDAIVDTNGFIASTLNITDADFLSNQLKFSGQGAGDITNAGQIRSSNNGDVVLIAPQIENRGVIQTENGDLFLVAGQKVTLTNLSTGHISFELQAPGDQVVNLGELISQGGAIGAYASQIRQSGQIEADRITQDADGTIRLVASDTIEVSGQISARGINGQQGGHVEILGNDITLIRAAIDVSGDTGGGTTLVGGDFQGGGDFAKAQNTFVDEGTSIDASASLAGDGGKIILWSEGSTVTHGKLSARGGLQSGDGGLIETSGRGSLDFSRAADVSATNGEGGTWLLDPEDIVINDSRAESIEDALNSGSNVSIKTSGGGDGEGNITVASPINKTEGDDAKLSLTAHNKIDVDEPIKSSSGKLDVKLKAGHRININANIKTNGGKLSTKITGIEEDNSDDDSGSDNDPSNEQDEDQETSDTSEDSQDGEGDSNDSSDTEVVNADEDDGTNNEDSTANDETADSDDRSEIPDVVVTGNSGNENTEDIELDEVTEQTANDVTNDLDNVITTVDNSTSVEIDIESVPTEVDPDINTDSTQTQPPDIDDVTENSPDVDTDIDVDVELDPETDSQFDDDSMGITINAEIITDGGEVVVDSGDEGTTRVSGVIDTSNRNEDQEGGDVTILGEHVKLTGLEVDASGDAGGGDVLIGGDFQGNNDEIRNATTTYVSHDTTITSDAVTNGDGGTVILWSDDTTQFDGTILSRGGSEGGDGGFAEVSGHQNLAFSGFVDLSAANGETGTLLLDPTDLNIVNAGTGTHDGEIAIDHTVNAGDPGAFFAIGSDAVEASLLVSNVLLQATNNITVDDIVTSASGNNLTLDAGNNILLNDNINLGTGDILLTATAGNISGNGVLSGDQLSLSAGGTIDVNTNVNTVAAESTGAGDITITETNGITIGSVNGIDGVSTAGGDITVIAAAGNISGTEVLSGDELSLSASGMIDVNTDVNAVDAQVSVGGDIVIDEVDAITLGSTSGVFTDDGNITVNAGGAITVNQTVEAFNDGNVSLTAATGDITLNADVNSGDNSIMPVGQGSGLISLTATAGSINSGGGTINAQGTTGAGGSLALSAATGIGSGGNALGTSVINLDVVNGANDVFITNSGELNLVDLGVDGNSDAVTNAGGGIITASSPLNVDSDVNMGSDFSLIAGNDNGAADDDLNINANVTHTNGGQIDLTAGDDVRFNGGTVTSVGGTVIITADNDGDIDGNDGNIIGSAGVGADIVTANLAMVGESIGSGSEAIETDVTTLAATSTAGMEITNVSSTNSALTIGTVGGQSGLTIGNVAGANDTISTSHDLIVNQAVVANDGGFILEAGTANDNANGNDLIINADVSETSGDGLDLIASGDVNLNGGTVSEGDTLTITADSDGDGDGSVTQSSGVIDAGDLVVTAAGGIDLDNAANDADTVVLTSNVAGDISYTDMDSVDVTGITAADGDVILTMDDITISGAIDAGTNDVSLRNLTAGVAFDIGNNNNFGLTDAELDLITADVLRIGSATSGNILISDVVSPANVGTLALNSGANITDTAGGQITVADLFLNAATGIGSSGNALNTAVTNLDLVNAANDVFITNSGTLNLVDLGVDANLDAVTNAGGGVITATSPLSVNSDVNMGADFSLVAGNSAGAGDDLTINADINHTTAGGQINLIAGDNVVFNGGTVTTAGAGTVIVTADDDGDGNGGAIIDNNGTVDINSFFLAASATDGISLDGNVNAGSALNTGSGNIDISGIAGTGLVGGISGISNNVLGGSVTLSSGALFDANADITANNGDISITANNQITFGNTINAGTGDIFLTSLNGNITADNPMAFNLIGDKLVLSASTDIAVGTNVNVVEAESFDMGDITINEANGLTVGSVGGLEGVSAVNGDVVINAGNTISVDESITAGNNGDITLIAANGNINIDNNIRSSAAGNGTGTLTLTAASGSITQTGGQLSASGAGGTVDLTAANDIGTAANRIQTDVENILAQSTVAGDIFINEADDVNLQNIITTASDIDIISGGTMNATSVTAGGGGSVTLETTSGDVLVGLITAGGPVTINSAGNIDDQQVDDVLDIDTDDVITLNAVGAVSSIEPLELPGGPTPDPDPVVLPDLPVEQEPPVVIIPPVIPPAIDPPLIPQLDNVLVVLDQQVPGLFDSDQEQEDDFKEGDGTKVFECR